MDVLWFPLAHPFGNEPDADKLAKNLRYLRRRDEITLQSELVPVLLGQAGVVSSYVAGKTHAHVAGERHRPSDLESQQGAQSRIVSFAYHHGVR